MLDQFKAPPFKNSLHLLVGEIEILDGGVCHFRNQTKQFWMGMKA